MNTVSQKAEWRFPIENSFVRDSSLSVDARLLYIIIKGYAGPNCEMPFPSLRTLAFHMDRHRESVQSYLSELVSAGYLQRCHIKIKGRFASTRYVILDRRGKKPLRFQPATENPATKSYQREDLPVQKHQPKSKETKVTSTGVDAVVFPEIPSEWKPDSRTKDEKLKSLKVPKKYPSELEFNAFLTSNRLDSLLTYRSNIYRDLCRVKWHTWREELGKWSPIVKWQQYVTGLDAKILESMPQF